MIDSLSVPPADSILNDFGDVLRVSGVADHPTLEFRVDHGLVFVRVFDAARHATPARPLTPAGGTSLHPDRQWHQAQATYVLDLFAANSPVATWLRARGMNLLGLALLGASGSDATGAEAS